MRLNKNIKTIKKKNDNRKIINIRFIAIVFIVIGLIGIVAISTSSGTYEYISDIKVIDVDDLEDFKGKDYAQIGIRGHIKAFDPIKMTDNNELAVFGEIQLLANSKSQSKKKILINWQNRSDLLFLEGDEKILDVIVQSNQIESFTDTSSYLNNLSFTTVRNWGVIKYFDKIFTLNLNNWNNDVESEVVRKYLPNNTETILICGLSEKGAIKEPINGRTRLVLPSSVYLLSNRKIITNIIAILMFSIILIAGVLLYLTTLKRVARITSQENEFIQVIETKNKTRINTKKASA